MELQETSLETSALCNTVWGMLLYKMGGIKSFNINCVLERLFWWKSKSWTEDVKEARSRETRK